MARVTFVEFLCIVAIGVAMVEVPDHGFLRQPGAHAAPGKVEGIAHATTRDVNVRPQPQERKQ